VITFEPLLPEHLPLLRDWLGREHVRRWWRDPEESLGHAEDALSERDATEYFLIVPHGRPVGTIQTYLVAGHPESEEVVGPGKAWRASTC
jgi:Acetyltransferase (GNAT) domain